MLLSPMSEVGLTVKTFIEIMRCRILNCRLVSQVRLLHLQCHYEQAAVSILQCTYRPRPTVINATVQNVVFKCGCKTGL